MKKQLAISFLCVALAYLICTSAWAESKSRRLVYVADTPAAELRILASRDEVHQDLGLTQEQIRQLADLEQMPITPEVRGFIRSFNEATRGLSGSSRDTTQTAMFTILNVIEQQNIKDYLGSILSEKQYLRFKQITLQVYGPSILLEFTDMSDGINLSTDQRQEMLAIIESFEAENARCRKALGRYAVSGIPFSDTDDKRVRDEIGKLCAQLRDASLRMDATILGLLDTEQKEMLRELAGKELLIKWDESSIFDF